NRRSFLSAHLHSFPAWDPIYSPSPIGPQFAGRAMEQQRIVCQWCQGQNLPGATSCRSCGAPLDVRNTVSDSGWTAAPRLRDMTEFQFSQSTCQVEGEIVPVADVALGAGDS